MEVIVTYTGEVMESYPAQIHTVRIEIINQDKVLQMYKTMIDHIMQEDIALNHEVKYIIC